MKGEVGIGILKSKGHDYCEIKIFNKLIKVGMGKEKLSNTKLGSKVLIGYLYKDNKYVKFPYIKREVV